MSRHLVLLVLASCAQSTPPANPATAGGAAEAGPPAELTVGGAVEGMLAAGEQRQHAFTITTPKAGSYYGDGKYQLELFVKPPPDNSKCTAAAGVELKIIDKDDTIVDSHAVGDSMETDNGDKGNFAKKQGLYDFAPGTYRVKLAAKTWCGAAYRVRLSTK
jgi:hypothetical protein